MWLESLANFMVTCMCTCVCVCACVKLYLYLNVIFPQPFCWCVYTCMHVCVCAHVKLYLNKFDFSSVLYVTLSMLMFPSFTVDWAQRTNWSTNYDCISELGIFFFVCVCVGYIVVLMLGHLCALGAVTMR